jgi:hypothetical protein
MSLRDFLQRYPGILTNTEIAYSHWLEQRGLRFAVDFGYANAFLKATEMMGLDVT